MPANVPDIPRAERPARPVRSVVRLKVLSPGRRRRESGPTSTVAKWRAVVLTLVTLLIVAHILHWWMAGRTVGRFVLSDCMATLERGEINPGFLLFGAALLASLLFGRFFCGWACHMGAMQDLCAWLLRRMGVRPRPLRARLLGHVPLGLALYMFVWPTFVRELLGPFARWAWPEAGRWFSDRPFPGFSVALTSTDFWAGLPGVALGIPFLLVCGFAVVWFLGARGLCQYVCPYGGLLRPAEAIAPVRIVADPARCDQCGLCTSACTAGVRVHADVARFAAVLDHRCVRSLDCISVCPHGALSLGVARPPALRAAGPASARSTYSLGQELASAAVFLVVFFSLRGAYGAVPLLFAAALAVIAAYAYLSVSCLFRDQNVRFGGFMVRRAGRLTAAGVVFVLALVLSGGVVVQAAGVKAVIWMAMRQDDRVAATLEEALAGRPAAPSDADAARRALGWYALARPIWEGGLALATTAAVPAREAWMHLVLGEREAAIDRLQSLVGLGLANDRTGPDLARLLVASGREQAARRLLETLASSHPDFHHTREALAWHLMAVGERREAERMLRAAVDSRPGDGATRGTLGRFLFATGRSAEGVAELLGAAGAEPRDSALRRDAALALFQVGRLDEAVQELVSGAELVPAARVELRSIASDMLRRAGREADAAALDSVDP